MLCKLAGGAIGSKTIAFAGGGHAHLYSLLRTGELVGRGFEVVLVNPSPYLYYSGMATGVISGSYTPEEDRIDVRRLVERGGGRFIEGRVETVRRAERELVLEGGERVPYDALSFNLGSVVPERGPSAEPGADGVLPVKPVANNMGIRDRLLGFEGYGSGPRVLIAGGGAAGSETAANVAQLLRKAGLRGRVTLAEAGGSLLGPAPEGARRKMREYLEERGVEVLLNSPVETGGEGAATAGGRRIEHDLLIPAVGLVPPQVFQRSGGLATGDDGGLWVNPYLQSISDPWVFGGGDCVSFRGAGLPKLGVFAIRQGPVLFGNLQAVLRDEPLTRFEPQGRYLYILNLGDGSGLAIYGPLSLRGRLAMRLKDRIDRKFMETYQV